MKDLSEYVVYQDGKFWIDTECEPDLDVFMGDDEPTPPFVVGEHFTFKVENPDDGCILSGVGVVECDDGVDEFAMIPFRVV